MPLSLVTSHLQRNLQPVFVNLVRPERLGHLAHRLPQRLNRLLITQLLNRVFAEQISDGDFDCLRQQLLQVEIIDAGLFVGIGFKHGRLNCQHLAAESLASDATLSIDTLSVIQLLQQEVDPDTLFFQRKLKINGNTELAHNVKNIIDTLDPDVMPGMVHKLLQQYRCRVLQPDV